MRVIINGIPLLSPRTGVGNYVYQNFKALLSITRKWDISFYYGIQWSAHLKNQPVVPVNAKNFIRRFEKAYPIYQSTLDLLFKIGSCMKKFDLYHETNYIPMQFNGPTILTIYDLSFHLYPEAHPKGRLLYLNRYFYPRLDRAAHFITISESIKQEMVHHLGLPEKKITVTPLGVDEYFRPVPIDIMKPILSRYELKAGSYVLYVGTIEPRKNIVNLLKAYACLPGSLRNSYPLVLAGGLGWLMEKLDVTIQQLGIQTTTIRTGYVPREDLPSLYSGAAVFVYPSVYEGFGLPPLEAMACNAPVITSNVSSLPEVVGDAGIMIHPEDIKRLSEEMESLLTDIHLREILSQKGLERVKQFTWEKCAAKTMEVYNHMMYQ